MYNPYAIYYALGINYLIENLLFTDINEVLSYLACDIRNSCIKH